MALNLKAYCMKTFSWLVFVFITTLFSCNKENENFNLETSIDISFIDHSGNDLLNEGTENHYDIKKIKLYYLIHGISTEVYDSNLDSPKGFFKSNDLRNGKYFLRLFPNQSNMNNRDAFETTTYLQLCNNETDTILCEFSKNINSLTCTKVVYNGSVVWQWNSERYITIQKRTTDNTFHATSHAGAR